MSSTRSGTIYSIVPVSKTNPPISNKRPAFISIPNTPTPISRSNIIRPAFFEPTPSPIRQQRLNRTQFSSAVLRDLCADSDNDSTSSYDSDDVEEEQEYQRQKWTHRPKYEVNIDFDEASRAWRENKRRVGESWVYKTKPEPKKTTTIQESSVASRLVRRTARVAATRR